MKLNKGILSSVINLLPSSSIKDAADQVMQAYEGISDIKSRIDKTDSEKKEKKFPKAKTEDDKKTIVKKTIVKRTIVKTIEKAPAKESAKSTNSAAAKKTTKKK